MSRKHIEALAIPTAWYAKSPTEIAKLILLWSLWAAAVVLVRYLVLQIGWWGIPAAIGVGALNGALVVAGLGFIGHDVSHGSVVKGEKWTRAITFCSLTMSLFIPYYLWMRWHNAFHHRYANTSKDSDRLLREEELESGLVSYPSYRWANQLGFSLQYVGFRVWKIIYGNRTLSDPKKRHDVLALSAAVGIYGVLGWLLGPLVFGLGVGVPLLVASITVSYYIQSNHFLRPQTDELDEVASSMDVDVPPIVDFFHSNFSAHTAHHLYPSVPSRHYKVIRRLVAEKYAGQYRHMGWFKAFWLNFRLPKLVLDGRFLVDRRGRIRAELY
jgi:fatty acid desaturase